MGSFKDLSKFEWALWGVSMVVVGASYALSGGGDILTMIASLIGVTALIFVAKGFVLGQILSVVFSVFYGIISFYFRYYGEMITYLFMTTPMAICALIAWIRHPHQGSKEVEVHRLSKRQWFGLSLSAIAVTVAFYFILGALGNANLFFSTLSITTSFLASMLTFFRSPYYALAYAANDIVLIVLWLLATIAQVSYLPMVACFIMFFINDLYGFINWKGMQKRQAQDE